MVFRFRLICVATISKPPFCSLYPGRSYSTKNQSKESKPLRILFCGSDEFSSASLRAVYAEQRRDPEFIKSIDVLCRPGKPFGRSLKAIREVPIKAAAQELGLTVHERDTFTGWELPKPENEHINLIIAVSFGLFVPPRILKAAEYGGLNVHPSLLPNFRGPAPLQHTILAGEKFTGVTLQTLDDQSFDKGIILAQERYKINSYKTCTYTDLLEFITPSAVEVLVKGLQCRLFVPPLVGIASSVPKEQLQYIRNAPKITPQDKEIHSNWRGTEILRRYRALGRLWINVGFDTKVTKRIIFEDFSRSRSSSRPDFGQWGLIQRNAKQLCTKTTEVEAESKSSSAGMMESEQTVHFVVGLETGGRAWPLLYIEEGDVIIMQAGSEYLRVNSITVEGQGKKAASKALQSLRNYAVWTIEPLSGEQGVVSATPQFNANK